MEYKDMPVDKLLWNTRMYPGCVSATESAAELGRRLADAQATVEALQRERDEAIREHGKESGFWGRSCARLLDKRDELQAALDAEREKVKALQSTEEVT